MGNIPRIWLTRPQADSAALAALLSPVATTIAPVIRIEPCDPAMAPALPDALLVTSRHALHFLAMVPDAWRALPTYCVGAATADALRGHGFGTIHSGEADVLALLPRLRALPVGTRLLHPCGEDLSLDIAPLLAAHGVVAESITVYRAAAVPQLPEPLTAALGTGEISGVVFYSPRSAAIAIDLLRQAGLASAVPTIDAYCLSLAVAVEAGAVAWRSLHACPVPTQTAMVELIVSRHRGLVL